MKRWPWLLVPVVLVFLLVQLPASLVLGQVAARLPQVPLRWRGLEGTIWRAEVAELQAGPLRLSGVRWRLSPLSLLSLSPALALESSGGDLRGQAGLVLQRDGGLAVNDADIQADATLLGPLLPWRGIQLGGQLHAQISSAELQPGPQGLQPQSLNGTLRWQGASVRSPLGEARPGGLALQVQTPEPGRFDGQLQDTDGLLGLTAQLQWQGGALAVQARSRKDLPPQIANFFRLFARDNGDHYSLEWQWRPQ